MFCRTHYIMWNIPSFRLNVRSILYNNMSIPQNIVMDLNNVMIDPRAFAYQYTIYWLQCKPH